MMGAGELQAVPNLAFSFHAPLEPACKGTLATAHSPADWLPSWFLSSGWLGGNCGSLCPAWAVSCWVAPLHPPACLLPASSTSSLCSQGSGMVARISCWGGGRRHSWLVSSRTGLEGGVAPCFSMVAMGLVCALAGACREFFEHSVSSTIVAASTWR